MEQGRRPAGTREGGQFSGKHHAEARIDLAGTATDSRDHRVDHTPLDVGAWRLDTDRYLTWELADGGCHPDGSHPDEDIDNELDDYRILDPNYPFQPAEAVSADLEPEWIAQIERFTIDMDATSTQEASPYRDRWAEPPGNEPVHTEGSFTINMDGEPILEDVQFTAFEDGIEAHWGPDKIEFSIGQFVMARAQAELVEARRSNQHQQAA